MNIQATVVNSSLLKHLTIPAFLKRASTAESELAIAPVCEEAARLPESVLPAFMAAMRHPFLMRDEAWYNNLSGFLICSIYSILTLESTLGLKFLSMYSNISSTPICFEFPTDHTDEKSRPLFRADSIMKRAVPPELEMKSTPFGSNSGIGRVNTPWKWVFIKPMQLGPINDAPASLMTLTISLSNAAPSFVSSPNPADIRMKALTFFCWAKTVIASKQEWLGIAMIAISVSGMS